jgi:hypothetical protein
VKLAFPEASRVTIPNFVLPSLNVTEPDGIPPPDELTLTLKVTGWPDVEGFSVDAIVTLLGSFTPCPREVVLVPQFTSPE